MYNIRGHYISFFHSHNSNIFNKKDPFQVKKKKKPINTKKVLVKKY